MKKKQINKTLLHVKKGDKVKVIAGDDKGAIGIVKEVLKKQNKVIIENINVRIKHIKPNRANEMGQIKEFAFPLHVSNVCKYEE